MSLSMKSKVNWFSQLKQRTDGIFVTAIRQRLTFSQILQRFAEEIHRHPIWDKLPSYMHSELNGIRQGWFSCIDHFYTEDRFNFNGSYVDRDLVTSWKDVKGHLRFWKGSNDQYITQEDFDRWDLDHIHRLIVREWMS